MSEAETERDREGGMSHPAGLRRVRLTQALAHGHAVLLGVEIVAVAGAAPVHETNALLLAQVEVPAEHGGAAGARLCLQRTHRCRGTAVRASAHEGPHHHNNPPSFIHSQTSEPTSATKYLYSVQPQEIAAIKA